MSTDGDLIKLYSGKILELATNIPHLERLESPQKTVKKRSPLCGSTVTVDVEMEDGHVSAFGQDVKACALGQAAAAVVGAQVIGRSAAEIVQARDELKAMLKSDGRYEDTDGGLLASTTLRNEIQRPGNAVTFTCVPPGSGARLGLDDV